MIPLTSEEFELYLNQANCHTYKQRFEVKYTAEKKYVKVRDHYHYTSKYNGAAHIILVYLRKLL